MSSKTNRAAIVARMQMGVKPTDAGADEEELKAAEAAAAEAAEKEAKEKAEPEAAEKEAKLKAEAEAGEPEGAGDGTGKADLSAELRADLKASLKENAKLEQQVESLQAQLEQASKDTAAAKTIITTCIERLAIGMNSTVVGLDQLSLSGLCTQFQKLDAQFTKTFPVGGVSRPVEAEAQRTVSDAEFSRRTAAARKTTKR